MTKLGSKSAVIAVCVALVLVVAGCFGTTDAVDKADVKSTGASVEGDNYVINPTWLVIQTPLLRGKVTGGAINGSNGTVNVDSWQGNVQVQLTDVKVSPWYMGATFTALGQSVTGVLSASNSYDYSGFLRDDASGVYFAIQQLSLSPA